MIPNTRQPKPKKLDYDSLRNRVVVGPIMTEEHFLGFLEEVRQKVGEYKSHFYRGHQNCGFVNFSDTELPQKAISVFASTVFEGKTLTVAHPMDFFDNEEDARPNQKKSTKHPGRGGSRRTSINHCHPIGAPSTMLVLKNLNPSLTEANLHSLLLSWEIVPNHVSLHLSGLCSNVAYVTFETTAATRAAADKLRQSKDFRGVEVDERPSTQRQHSLPLPSLSQNDSLFSRSPSPVRSFRSLSPSPSASPDQAKESQTLLSDFQYFLGSQHMTELTMRLPGNPADQREMISLANEVGIGHRTFFDDDAQRWMVKLLKQSPSPSQNGFSRVIGKPPRRPHSLGGNDVGLGFDILNPTRNLLTGMPKENRSSSSPAQSVVGQQPLSRQMPSRADMALAEDEDEDN
eukprot:c17160_g1_i3.p1 GENE.c17160_g1_i3~~c17160_g1_i3.p1  ORF type:complete len:402 (+),score=45.99 c17160_g1_i3:37-1242(+)